MMEKSKMFSFDTLSDHPSRRRSQSRASGDSSSVNSDGPLGLSQEISTVSQIEKAPPPRNSSLKGRVASIETLNRLKSFLEYETKYTNILAELIRFHEKIIEIGLATPVEAEEIVPDCFREIRSIHCSIAATLKTICTESSEVQSISDVCRSLETTISILISERTVNSYSEYAKSFPRSIITLRHLERLGKDIAPIGIDISQIYSFLGAPMNRIGEYLTQFAVLYDDLDERARRCVTNAVKSLDLLHLKSRSKAFASIFQ